MNAAKWIAAVALALACPAASVLAAAGDEAPNMGNSDAFRQGYKAGFDDGFSKGYQKAVEERAAVALPAFRPTGPITVSRAMYGSDSRLCDATRWTASRANGRKSASFEVTNQMCGDPAPGDRKTLEVTYVCGSVAKTATANEHRTVTLDCTS